MLSSIPSMFWGVGALVWVPLSVAIGKRPVFLFCAVLLSLSTFWAAVSRSLYSHLGARCVQGFAGSISPSTMLLMLIDLTYIHQRPQYLAVFWCLCNCLANIGLALTPYIISAGESWRCFYWIWFGPCLLSVLITFFFCPETSFQRPAVAFDGHILAQSTSGGITVYSDWEEVPGGKPMPEVPVESKWKAFVRERIIWDLNKAEGWTGVKSFGHQFILCVLNPLIVWSLVLNALVFGSMIITCTTFVQILMASPYNFSFTAIGLAKLSPAAGALLALPVSGFVATRIVRFLTKRNKGVREPENYLPSFIIPILACCSSLALFGFAAENHWDWRWICLFVGLDYFSAIALFTANTLWVTESFPRWTGPVLVVVGAGSYGISFALSSGVIPWMSAEGFTKTYIQLAMVILILSCAGIPVNIWGKRFREYVHARWGSTVEAL
ncbi:major facilitator superfamily transporter [Phlyctema vagabunda]|uniref:Major facilitator superfamily transporter n=1 Tax=Phlyctema vagabunda TaxID=108571 RepID=A0ABR4P2E6_9HELO